MYNVGIFFLGGCRSLEKGNPKGSYAMLAENKQHKVGVLTLFPVPQKNLSTAKSVCAKGNKKVIIQ